MGLGKISNVILTVSDLERSLSFYRDILGIRVKDGFPGDFIFLDGGGTNLVLRKGKANPGHTEVVFEVTDIHTTYNELRKKGITFLSPLRPVTYNETSDLYATDFRDPDNHIWSITGWRPKFSL